ncbi:hypothetical protein Nepgr_006208 [Nepenthes gracilis]|uniref:Uncharacterized protein n=1 Tax=Nepenthes gracilis TaxID=150966 RepID=A0AAD3S4L2_NEPGR|nr:hypothetical protein Nepgr_006208 [Nepenthes gracilis]
MHVTLCAGGIGGNVGVEHKITNRSKSIGCFSLAARDPKSKAAFCADFHSPNLHMKLELQLLTESKYFWLTC